MITLIRNFIGLFKQGGLLFILLCIMAMNCFFPTIEYFVCLFCGLVFILARSREKDNTAVMLLIFGFVHTCILIFNGKSSGMGLLLANMFGPFFFYNYGKHLVKRNLSEKDLLAMLLIVLIALQATIYYNVWLDYNNVGIVNENRYLGDEENEWIKATILGMVTSVGFCGLPAFLSINKPLRSPIAIGYLLMTVLSLISGIHLVNRAGLFVFVFCFFVALFYLSRKRSQRHVIILFLVLIIGLLYYITNISVVADIINAYQARDVGDVTSAGGRTLMWSEGLHNLFSYPFGWSNQGYYHHNLWLDVGRDTGIISFFLLVVAFIMGHKPIFKLVKIKGSPWVCTLLGLNVCFFASSFVEPVTHASPFYFYMYCLFFGLQRATLDYSKYIEWDMTNSN